MPEEPLLKKRYFDEKVGILYTFSTGEVSFQEMLQREQNIAKLAEVTKNLKILEDARDAKANFTVYDLQDLVDHLEVYLKDFESVRHAVIHSDPTSTAYVMLVDHLKPTSKYKIKVFSSIQAAEEWLKDNKS